MFKSASSEDELFQGMWSNLKKNAEEYSPKHQISRAIDLLDEAAKIFEQAGMEDLSDQVVEVLNKCVEDANLVPFPEVDKLNAKDKFKKKNKDICPACHKEHNDKTDCDYEECGYCGFDHEYELKEARDWHLKNDLENDIYK